MAQVPSIRKNEVGDVINEYYNAWKEAGSNFIK